jgi:hypothetical protein
MHSRMAIAEGPTVDLRMKAATNAGGTVITATLVGKEIPTEMMTNAVSYTRIRPIIRWIVTWSRITPSL